CDRGQSLGGETSRVDGGFRGPPKGRTWRGFCGPAGAPFGGATESGWVSREAAAVLTSDPIAFTNARPPHVGGRSSDFSLRDRESGGRRQRLNWRRRLKEKTL